MEEIDRVVGKSENETVCMMSVDMVNTLVYLKHYITETLRVTSASLTVVMKPIFANALLWKFALSEKAINSVAAFHSGK